MPPPHFCFKVVCKKGEGVFSGAYGTIQAIINVVNALHNYGMCVIEVI